MARRKRQTYILTSDITIPSGSKVSVFSARTTHYTGQGGWCSILIGPSKDCTAELILPLDEALKIGLVDLGQKLSD